MPRPFLSITLLGFLALICFPECGGCNQGTTFYLSPKGNDTWSGRLPAPNKDRTDGPCATLDHVRDVIRAIKDTSRAVEGGYTVCLRGGVYSLTQTFRLSSEDSGTPTAPVVYRGYGDEEVRLIGGLELEPQWFGPVRRADVLARLPEAARDQVRQVDLKAHGITDYGTPHPRGMGRPIVPAALELFFGDEPMPLARWPNEGWARIVSASKGPQGGTFTYEGDRPAGWSQPENVWLHGYWTKEWADSYEQVASIDLQARRITTREPHGVYGYSPKGRYYAFNILEELDRPGEWYLDIKSGILYFWPPGLLAENRLFVSILEAPLVLMEDVSHVTFRDLVFEVTRGHGLVIARGAYNLIAACTFRNLGNRAVTVSGGKEHGIVGCDIYGTGDGGIVLSGGDRPSLTPAGLYARNNHIRDFSRWVRTYSPAVKLLGVGNVAEHNLIHDGPHVALILGGNDHLAQLNEIHDVCTETGDAGAVYMGRNWTYRGNIIRYNYFHDIRATQTNSVKTVYLDDFISGTTVFGNIFREVDYAVFIGGGRDNAVENNLFVNASPAIHIDERGADWAEYHVIEGGVLRQRLSRVDYRNPPWSTRYPGLVSILDDQPALPRGNTIRRNVVVGGRWLHLTTDPGYVTFQDNDTTLTQDCLQLEGAAVNLKDSVPAYDRGFQPIPTHEIGLYLDEYRRYLP